MRVRGNPILITIVSWTSNFILLLRFPMNLLNNEKTHMKQVLRRGFSSIVVETVPDPVAGPGKVLIRNFYSLISSGTESASIHQHGILKAVADNPSHLRTVWNVLSVNGPVGTFAELKARFSAYAVLGYSGAGIIVAKHPMVQDLELGQRVAYGGEGTGHGETISVSRNLVVPVPDRVPLNHACFTTLGAIAMNAVRTAQIGLGESVVILGLGLVGQLTAQLVRCQGGMVIGADLRPERVELVKSMGADHGVVGDNTRESVLALTGGRGADCVIISAASKSKVTAQLALQLTRDRGRIVVVGAVPIEFSWHEMYLKEIEVRMSRAYGPGSYDPLYEQKNQDYPLPYVRWTENRNMEEFLRLVGTGQVKLEPLITHRFRLEEAPKAYDTIMAAGSSSMAVTLEYEAASQLDPLASFQPQRRVETTARPATVSGDLQLALIGAGNIAKWAHMPALKKLSRVGLSVVQTSIPAKAKEYAERFGAGEATTELDSVLGNPKVHAVLIVNRNAQHAGDCLAALAAGKHVFVEKPMALTSEDCMRLIQAEKKTNLTMTIGFNRRFAPMYMRLKNSLASRVGPALIQCRVNSPGISGNYWMASPEAGGAILGEACHFVDLMYWLLGSEPVEVSAFCLPAANQHPVAENNMASTFRFEDGSVANLLYCTAGSATSAGERIEVFTDGLAAGVEDFKQFWLKTRTVTTKSSIFAEKGYDLQMKTFVDAIAGRGANAVTVRDGARATLACLAMLESARNLQPRVIDLESLYQS